MKRTRLKRKSKSDTAQCKDRIQKLLREHVIQRDGGCVLRHYEEAGACGGYRNDGVLILQAEHLITRSNSGSYGEMGNIVCLCKRHHGFWKPQHSRLYWELIERHIGEERWTWLKRVEADKRPHRFTLYDWEKTEMGLRQDLKNV